MGASISLCLERDSGRNQYSVPKFGFVAAIVPGPAGAASEVTFPGDRQPKHARPCHRAQHWSVPKLGAVWKDCVSGVLDFEMLAVKVASMRRMLSG